MKNTKVVQISKVSIKDFNTKAATQSRHKRTPSIILDSPIDSYFPGQMTAKGSAAVTRESINSTADTIDTPPTSFNSLKQFCNFQSTQKGGTSSNKSNKNLSPLNFTQCLDSLVKQDKKQPMSSDSQYIAHQKSKITGVQQKRNQSIDSSDDEDEHQIWDNNSLEAQGFDCNNFKNKHGKDLTFYQLYRMRQCQLLGNISRRASINEVYIIAEHYGHHANKVEFAQQQKYMEDNYKVEMPIVEQTPVSSSNIRSAQTLETPDAPTPKKASVKHSQSQERGQQFSSGNLIKKNPEIERVNTESSGAQSPFYYIKKNLKSQNSSKADTIKNKTVHPLVSKSTSQNYFRINKQINDVHGSQNSESSLLCSTSVFSQNSMQQADKKFIQISYLNTSNQKDFSPISSSSASNQKQQALTQSIFHLQNAAQMRRNQSQKAILEKKSEIKQSNEPNVMIKKFSLIRNEYSTSDLNSPKHFQKTQQYFSPRTYGKVNKQPEGLSSFSRMITSNY